MKSQKNVYTLSSILLIAALLTQFQNCGSTSAGSSAQSHTSDTTQLIDEYSKSELQFVLDEVEVIDGVQSTTIDGFCSRARTGLMIQWRLFEESHMNSPVAREGELKCKSGQFSAPLEGVDALTCGEAHLILVEGEWGVSSFARVTVRCEPPLRKWLNTDSENLPYGTSCALESRPSSSGPEVCQKICVRADKVVYKENLEASSCSEL